MGKVEKKRGCWTNNKLEGAIEALRGGQSQRQVEKDNGIPRRTLRNHLKTGVCVKKNGRPTIMSNAQEEQLVKGVLRYADIGIPLTPKFLRHSVYRFVEIHNIPHVFNTKTKIAGKDRLAGFKKRHPCLAMGES